MTALERKLLLLVARTLVHLLYWKNVNGNQLGYEVQKAIDEVEQETQNGDHP